MIEISTKTSTEKKIAFFLLYAVILMLPYREIWHKISKDIGINPQKIIALFLFVFFIILVLKNDVSINRSHNIVLLAMINVVLFSMVINFFGRNLSIWPTFSIIQMFLFGFVVATMIQNRRDLDGVLFIFFITAVISSIILCTQFILRFQSLAESGNILRISSFERGLRNTLAHTTFSLPALPIGFYLLSKYKKRHVIWKFYLTGISMILVCLSVTMGQTRTGYVVLSVILLAYIVTRRNRIYSIIVLLFFLGTFIIIFHNHPYALLVRKRIDTLLLLCTPEYQKDRSLSERYLLHKTGLEFLSSEPIFGIGAGNFMETVAVNAVQKKRSAESLYLQCLVEGGLALFSFYLIIIICNINKLVRLKTDELKFPKQPLLPILIIICFLGLLLPLMSDPTFYLIVGLGIAAVKIYKIQTKVIAVK